MKTFIKVAREAAIKAGEYLKEKIETARIVKYKGGLIDIVTDADIGAQELIIGIIKEYFPSHQILAEEQNKKIDVSNQYVWAIDPVDGTSAFTAGLRTYCSSIALLYNKKPIVGAIYLALSDEVIWAAKGKGTFKSEKQVYISSKKNLRESTIGFDPSYFPREKDMVQIAAPLSDKTRIMPMIWAQASALSLVACGVFDGFIQCGSPKVWDVAAGKLMVEEAGGILTSFTGGEIDIFNLKGYVAASKPINKQLLQFTKT